MSDASAVDGKTRSSGRGGTLLLALKHEALTDAQLQSIITAAPDLDVVVTRDKDRIVELLPDIRAAFGAFPQDLIGSAPALEWWQLWSAGADRLFDDPAVVEHPMVLTNAAGVHPVPISEHIFAFLLAFARQLPRAVKDQLAERWQPPGQDELFELQDKTMLLVGAGRIGERVAVLGSAFGMRVIAVRRDPGRPVDGTHGVHGVERLDELLPQADFVVITVPLTTATRGMFAAAQFAALKDGAYLINIGRGGTVVEDDLIAALKSGRLAGAGLDVFEEEPLPAGSALWSMDNVIVTSHYSGATPRYVERVLEIFLDNLRRFNAGEEMRNIVDKELGY